MKKLLVLFALPLLFVACKNDTSQNNADNGKQLAAMLDSYWQEHLQMFPVDATGIGDNRYNDQLTITIAESFRDSLGRVYKRYLDQVSALDSSTLNRNDLMSYRLFKYEMQMGLEGLKYPTHYMPITQFWSFTLDLPQLGSGSGNQPFKTVKDYDNWLKQLLSGFPAWADTAIYNMRKGIAALVGYCLKTLLVVKILPGA